MSAIRFATSNKLKLAEAKLACGKFNIEVKQVEIKIDEIQSVDPLEISKHKAESAYAKILKPIVVTDTYWQIPALNGFPGAFMKFVNSWFTSEDFLNLMNNKDDKRVGFTESITYKSADDFKTFSQTYWGKFVDTPRGIGNAIEKVAEFDGVTLGERRESNTFSHKPEEYIWWQFAEWYSSLK
jgi:XTP/dITP diphosphohydrolase